MTEYWVSQGNKWCDTCKIFLSNNPASIRNHELGTRHKENVAKRLTSMREDKAKKEKQEKQAVRLLEQIEAKAKRSYEKDLETFREAKEANLQAIDVGATGGNSSVDGEWEYNSSTGYYYNQKTACYYDPNSGFYYTDALGKWVTQEEALAASVVSSSNTEKFGKPQTSEINKQSAQSNIAPTPASGPAPGRVVSKPLNPMRSVSNSVPSSIAVTKRKRPEEKPKTLSKEEAAAVKAREAARKRTEEREKPLLGLYKR